MSALLEQISKYAEAEDSVRVLVRPQGKKRDTYGLNSRDEGQTFGAVSKTCQNASISNGAGCRGGEEGVDGVWEQGPQRGPQRAATWRAHTKQA